MKNIKICIVGLGYVGLPLALEFNRKYNVIGFDLNKNRINQLKKKLILTMILILLIIKKLKILLLQIIKNYSKIIIII